MLKGLWLSTFIPIDRSYSQKQSIFIIHVPDSHHLLTILNSPNSLFLCLDDDVSQSLTTQPSRLPGTLAAQSVAAAQAVAVQAAMAAQVAALEHLREKLESGEPPEKKMALPTEDHQRLLQRALQQNLLAMSSQMPMNIRINNQGNNLFISNTHTTYVVSYNHGIKQRIHMYLQK